MIEEYKGTGTKIWLRRKFNHDIQHSHIFLSFVFFLIQAKTDLKKLLGFGGGGVPLGQTGAVKKKN